MQSVVVAPKIIPMSYKGWAKGKIIELEEPLPFAEGQVLRVSVEPATPRATPGSPRAILEAMAEVPHLRREDADLLDAAIESAKLPLHEGQILNDG